MATRGRPPGQGKVPGSGRKKGSLDRSARLLISEQVAFDILKTYKRLGPDWLFEIAKSRPDLFLNQCLSKLLPPAFREDMDGVTTNNTINVNNLSDRDAAMRIAFVLNSAIHGDPALNTRDVTLEAVRQDPVAPRKPEPEPDPERVQWASSLGLTPEERANQKLIRETKETSIETYHGGPGEQSGPGRSPVTRKPTVSELRRRQLL